ncbi:MAG: peptide-methionine (R)-S-oxide reductase MsrB [Lentimonas sp.]
MSDDMRDNSYWKDKLSKDEFHVLREKGTERAFTGEYWNCDDAGIYRCRACGEPLFESDKKFDAGCGWPSFYRPMENTALEEIRDTSHGMIRTEVTCRKCGGHLGHVFPDGPTDTGLRYCINSLSIKLDSEEKS